MRNNTMNHVSDQASTVKFVPKGTDWPDAVTDVQTALEKIGSWANKDNGLPLASTTVKGVMMICTVDEVQAGTVNDKAVSPKVLKEFQTKPHATKDEYGTTRYASNDQMMELDNPNITVNASGLNFIFENRIATESRSGAMRVATTTQAREGTQDDRIMTPLKVKAAIDALVPKSSSATESSEGVVKLATVSEIQAGTARNGVSISPYGFANARGTSSAYGTFKAATDSQMTSFSGDDAAVTPAALGRNKGSTTKHGVVKLATSKVNEANVAIAATAEVIYAVVGMIMPFYGTVIPAGFAPCDGMTHNGVKTPNLNGKFIMGSTYEEPVGTMGGRNKRTLKADGTSLNLSHLPKDPYTLTIRAARDNGSNSGGEYYLVPPQADGGGTRSVKNIDYKLQLGSGTAHEHLINGGNEIDFRPEYCSINYIMYVGY